MSSKDLALYLRIKMGEKRSKNTDIVRKANISRRTWYRLLNADIQEAKLSTLIKVANALDITVTELLQVYFEGKKISSPRTKSRLYAADSGSGFDVNYPDNSLVNVAESFTKVWEVVNRSNMKRSQLTFQCLDDQLEVRMMRAGSGEMVKPRGLVPESNSIMIEDLDAGEARQISVTFKAPASPCTTISHWCFFQHGKMLDADELPHLRCQVRVIRVE